MALKARGEELLEGFDPATVSSVFSTRNQARRAAAGSKLMCSQRSTGGGSGSNGGSRAACVWQEEVFPLQCWSAPTPFRAKLPMRRQQAACRRACNFSPLGAVRHSSFCTPPKHKPLQTAKTDQYFLDSANNISFFFEEKAFDAEGRLVKPKALAVNKIGHGAPSGSGGTGIK